MKRLSMITAFAVIGFLLTSTAALAAGRDDDDGSKIFQVALDLEFTDNTFRAESDFAVENSTLLLKYISCTMASRSPTASNAAAFDLFVNTESSGRIQVLNGLLEPGRDFAPGPGANLIGNAFVTACIGKKCESLNGETYESFSVDATRNDNFRTEYMRCLLTGEIVD